MSIEGKLVNELTATTPAINDIALSTESASPTILKRSTWQSIYNLFKGLYDSASATLTNKTISGESNTLTNIAQSSVTNLTTDLAGKAPINNPSLTGTLEVNGQNWTSAWTSWTPVISGSTSGTANITGTLGCKFKIIGKTVDIQGRINFTKSTLLGEVRLQIPTGTLSGNCVMDGTLCDAGGTVALNGTQKLIGLTSHNSFTISKGMGASTYQDTDLGAGGYYLIIDSKYEIA